ncbi:hypothetical protein SDC9_20305 [bioreactor metagenome]|uniref:Transposase IS30-like HTH domain-containing protein n=1 Tax=bioreactor metagenome TaxID=1076179 RepID=A0A644U6H0_9ZZZZ|nr:hypothetical protein [Methanocorpusculum sp.]
MRYWYSYPELLDKEKLMALLAKHKRVSAVALHLGCSRHSVETAMMRHGIEYPSGYVADMVLAPPKN